MEAEIPAPETLRADSCLLRPPPEERAPQVVQKPDKVPQEPMAAQPATHRRRAMCKAPVLLTSRGPDFNPLPCPTGGPRSRPGHSCVLLLKSGPELRVGIRPERDPVESGFQVTYAWSFIPNRQQDLHAGSWCDRLKQV